MPFVDVRAYRPGARRSARSSERRSPTMSGARSASGTRTKSSLPQAGMGDDQVGLVDVDVADQQDIDVERARTPALGPDAAGIASRPTWAAVQELPGGQVGLELQDAVEVGTLIGRPPDRVGLVDRARRRRRRAARPGPPVDWPNGPPGWSRGRGTLACQPRRRRHQAGIRSGSG